MTVELALSKFKKEEGGEVRDKYLYDEILDRLRKASCEMAYCVRHGGGLFHYEDLVVTIDICSNEESEVLATIPWRFKIAGYPRFECDICEEREASEELSTGEKLASDLRRRYPEKC